MKIIVVGGGISGLTCAHLLSQSHEVLLLEANDRLGGHSHTVTTNFYGKPIAVDTGFIVYNHRTYPLFCQLLDELGIVGQASDMSFSYSDTELTYQGGDLAGLFCDRNNFKNAAFWRMVRDILRFNRAVKGDRSEQTLGDFLASQRYGTYFADKYLLPMCAAIWSSPAKSILDFPVHFLFDFLRNHGLVNIWRRPQWMTVKGGSQQYINALCATKRWRYRLSELVQRVVTGGSCSVETLTGRYAADAVVLACHSDQAASLLATSAHPAQPALSQMKYQRNTVFLHADSRWVSSLPRARAAWHYGVHANGVYLTYDMNRLQGIPDQYRCWVTLNPPENQPIDRVMWSGAYWHPLFTHQTLHHQQMVQQHNGWGGVYFAGAYLGNGFHEDGVRSAHQVAQRISAPSTAEVH
jgi:predicted NAD/FAD-binding protein